MSQRLPDLSPAGEPSLVDVAQARTAAIAALDVLPVPSWVVRADLHVEHANTAALQACRSGWALQHSGFLVRIGHLAKPAMAAHVATFAAEVDSPGVMLVASATIGPRLLRGTLRLIPLGSVPLYGRAWPRGAALLMLEAELTALDKTPWIEHIGEQLDLTPAQRGVLALLGEGRTPAEIAQEFQLKLGTVRAHMHELFRKTGLARQAELVRLVLGR